VETEQSQIYALRRVRMVDDQIARRGVRDESVLAAMRSVPRHLFVPDSQVDDAYRDGALPIGFGQTISQPYIVAIMTALLKLDVRSRVLEIGTGCGYQTAVLAELVGEVYTIERVPQLAERAAETLGRLGYRAVQALVGDGSRGWREHAPYDAIIVTAAAAEAPFALLRELAPDGRLVVPIGAAHGEQMLTVFVRRGDTFEEHEELLCRFVPLIEDRGPEQDDPGGEG
jgi:protein-L-isoaspartate(D-aspartate) O-methyltransferase